MPRDRCGPKRIQEHATYRPDLLASTAAVAAAGLVLAQTGPADLIAAAGKERKLSIYGTTDSAEACPVLESFREE